MKFANVHVLLLCASAFAQDPRAGITASILDRAIPQVIFGGEWQTIITIINGQPNPVTIPVDFFGQDGAALTVPLVGFTRASSYRLTVPANGSITVETEQPRDTAIGWGKVDPPLATALNGPITGHVILRNRVPNVRPDYEAVFPFYNYLASKSFIPYDNLNGFATVLFLTNTRDFGTTRATVTVAFRDESGNRVHLDQFTMAPKTSQFYTLAAKYPQTASVRGVAEFSVTDGYLVLCGLRINPTNAFTALQSWEP